MKTVGPTTKRKKTSSSAAIALALERYCTPFSMPVTAESTKQSGQDGDHAHGHPLGLAGAEHVVEATGDLQGAQAQRGRRAEERREDRDDVDRLARALRRAASQQRAERARDQVAGALAVGEVADREADHGVHRPGVEAPVEEGVLHRDPRAVGGRRVAPARRDARGVGRGEVGQRLGDAPEHQADAHAGREHHRDPRERRELRLGVVGTEPDVAVAGHREVAGEEQERRTDQDEQPAERGLRATPSASPVPCPSPPSRRSPRPGRRSPAPAATPKVTLSSERSATLPVSVGPVDSPTGSLSAMPPTHPVASCAT